ncbi:BglII/BstYI family type II restriction endonuclease [Microbacterium sp. 22179]|uniref:BglII/BstYI family type II restriction endonuclease n=1 Tax=Microbacterium sp. 22179 TaxID=3453886 RepID=UPI003F863423
MTYSYDNPTVVPPAIRSRYEWAESGNAAAILNAVAPVEFAEFLSVLDDFELHPNEWLRAGGNKGDLTAALDRRFRALGWEETRIDFEIKGYLHTDFHAQGVRTEGRNIEEVPALKARGYRVDNFKGRMIVDIEWNAKDGNLDRDLSAYRSWHENALIDGAVIITKDRANLRGLAEQLWSDYQQTLPSEHRSPNLPIDLKTSTTTTLANAEDRLLRGGSGTCPVLLVGVSHNTWDGSPFTGS